MPAPGGRLRRQISNWEQTGDGAVQTTVEDLAKWDRNFYDPKVGGPALVEQLQTTGVLNGGETIPYARGLCRGRAPRAAPRLPQRRLGRVSWRR